MVENIFMGIFCTHELSKQVLYSLPVNTTKMYCFFAFLPVIQEIILA